MTNQANVPSTGATRAPERSESTVDAPTLKPVVTSVATVLVAAAITATSVFLIADEAPTTGVFGGQVSRAAQAAEQQLVNGIDPATDLADILRFGAGTGAVSAAEAAEQQLVDGIDPATDLADILRFGVGTVSAAEAAEQQLVDGIDPTTDVREALGLGAVPARFDSPAIWELVRGIDPSIDVRSVLGLPEPEPWPDFTDPFPPWGNIR
jgi:hypothetical protein